MIRIEAIRKLQRLDLMRIRKTGNQWSGTSKLIDPRQTMLPIFDAHTLPNVCKFEKWREPTGQQLAESLLPGRKELLSMPVCMQKPSTVVRT